MADSVLITGGTSTIGQGIADHFLRKNWSVTAHYHSSTERADQLSKEDVLTLQADLSTPAGCEQLIESYRKHYDNLDLLVNNAALFRRDGSGDSQSSDWDEQMSVNARAPYHLSLGCAEELMGHGTSIINLTDGSTDRPYSYYGAYFASKAALENVTKSLAKRLAPEIRVNAIAPGPINFPDEYTEKEKASIVDRTLLNRPGAKEEIADAVDFLATGGTYTTGTILEVDGGKHLT